MKTSYICTYIAACLLSISSLSAMADKPTCPCPEMNDINSLTTALGGPRVGNCIVINPSAANLGKLFQAIFATGPSSSAALFWKDQPDTLPAFCSAATSSATFTNNQGWGTCLSTMRQYCNH